MLGLSSKKSSDMYSRGIKVYGRVVKAGGIFVEAILPFANVGNLVEIIKSGESVPGEVVGFNENRVIIMPYRDIEGIKKGDRVLLKNRIVFTKVGEGFLGKVIDPFGNPYNGEAVFYERLEKISLTEINPLEREKISEVFDTGVRSINALLTLGIGQKVGVFSGAGVGKSTLLGMITRNSEADAVVIALIGERGREVKEFVEDVLGEEGLKKSVVIVSTADQFPILKVKGAISAIVHARYLASKGMNVLLVMDSITRLAQAQREVGLAVGEPPTLKGFTPSVFKLLTQVVESCGNFKKGSITGIFSVLVEGDEISLDPIADALMGVLDGHIILSRQRANRGLFPAIDPLRSISRLMPKLVSEKHIEMASFIREILGKYEDVDELVRVGLYKRGSNPVVDKVIEHLKEIEKFFKQKPYERVSFEESVKELEKLYNLLSQ